MCKELTKEISCWYYTTSGSRNSTESKRKSPIDLKPSLKKDVLVCSMHVQPLKYDLYLLLGGLNTVQIKGESRLDIGLHR